MANLTIADIARETGIAESTLRFYRDRFGHYIPSVGEGRKRRYEPQAVGIFKEIADLSSKGQAISDLEQYLSEIYPHNPIIVLDETETAITAAEPQTAVTATKTQQAKNPAIMGTPETAVTAVRPQTAITAVTAKEPQYILSLLELLKATPQKEPEKLYCNAKEAAIITGLSQDFIKKSCRGYLESKQGLPCIRTGRGYVIHKGMLKEWFADMITGG